MNKSLLGLLCGLAVGGATSVSGQSVYYTATSGYTFLPHMVLMPPVSLVEQTFLPTLGAIDFADVGFTPPATGVNEFEVREVEHPETRLTASRAFQPGAGVFGRTRVVFTNAVTVTPGVRYKMRIITVTPPSNPVSQGSLALVANSLDSGGVLTLDGVVNYRNLDFGVGLLIPDILPAGGRNISYVERQGDLRLFPEAHFTNDFVTNYAFSQLWIRQMTFAGSGYLRVESEVSNVVYAGGIPVGNLFSPNDGYVAISFNTNATAAAVQAVLRQIIYRNNESCWSWLEPMGIRIMFFARELTFFTQTGVTEEVATIRVTPVDEPPNVGLGMSAFGYFPESAKPVAVASTRHGAEVFLDGADSWDCEGDGPLTYEWTSPEQPAWSSSATNLTHRFALGLNHVKLAVRGSGLTGEKTVEFEVIKPIVAVRRLKRSVSGAMSGRERLVLLRYLAQAQTALALGHPRSAALPLRRFEQAVGTTYPITFELMYYWDVAAGQIREAITP